MQYAMTIKQMMDMNKKTFDDSFKSIVAVGEHVEKMVQIFLEQSVFFPKEGKKAFRDWSLTYKSGLDEFKMNADRRFDLVVEYILKTADQIDDACNVADPSAGRFSFAVGRAGKKETMDAQESMTGKTKVKREKVRRKSIKKTNKKNQEEK